MGFWRTRPRRTTTAALRDVIRTGLEEVLADLDTDPTPLDAVTRGRPGIAPTLELLRPRALVYMPLRARDRILGVLALIRIERELHDGRRRDRSRARGAGRRRGRQRQPLQRRRTRT